MTMLGRDEAYHKLDQLIDSHFAIFMQPSMLNLCVRKTMFSPPNRISC